MRLSHDDTECLSAGADGSCIVWNLTRGVRANVMFASTVFRSVVFHPDESQILTCGSDRKVWLALDSIVCTGWSWQYTASVRCPGVVIACALYSFKAK